MTPEKQRKPILVTGAPRTGTTWTGRMLNLSSDIGFIYEPFNIVRRPTCKKVQIGLLVYTCPPESNEEYYKKQMQSILNYDYRFFENLTKARDLIDGYLFVKSYLEFNYNKFNKKRPLVKDPVAIFSAEWLYKTFDMDVFVTIRHPAAFVSSFKKLGWTYDYNHF
ncbi:MAG: sulfotransferase [Methanolobus sp.]